MAKSQTKSRRARSRSNSNNPEGHNQYTGWMDLARERPATAAAAAAGAVAAGVFLWSKRAQISEQLSQLSDQIGEWTDTMGDRASAILETVGSEAPRTATSSPMRRSRATTNGRRPGTSNGSSLNARNSSESPVA